MNKLKLIKKILFTRNLDKELWHLLTDIGYQIEREMEDDEATSFLCDDQEHWAERIAELVLNRIKGLRSIQGTK